MLPTHRTQPSSNIFRRPFSLRVIFEVVISKTFVSRASRVERNLFLQIPHLQVKRRNLSSHRSWLAGANIDNKSYHLSLFILTQLYTLVKKKIYCQYSSKTSNTLFKIFIRSIAFPLTFFSYLTLIM